MTGCVVYLRAVFCYPADEADHVPRVCCGFGEGARLGTMATRADERSRNGSRHVANRINDQWKSG